MSSSPLYLAIVVVWLIVLVPMLLRKDPDTFHEDPREDDEPAETEAREDAEGRAEDPDATETQVLRRDDYDTAPADAPAHGGDAPRPGRYRAESGPRARVIARRRRRTTTLTLVNAATLVAVALGLGPWWVAAPPVLLFAGHLVLLREAAKADAERREAARRAHRREVLRARRDEAERRREAEREAEVIALKERRSQVYDQYADARLRAAGD
ncbi:divisome protein SepX/GlpR [Nocardiopsis sp. M1B1]|uniref:divisome protein SepX/GlpR n=1 Tax=Nocardiopsis sp. M1B1 TaxID=3450454 RepID=UPI00403946CD